jgi:hypothetical protein
MTTVHAILNSLYHFFGLGGTGPRYAFWSGAGSDIGEVTLIGAVLVAVRRVNCHDKGCWRIVTHPVDGTPFKACHKHHPVLSKQPRITAEIMAKAHEEVHEARRAEAVKLDAIHERLTALEAHGGAPATPPDQRQQ